MSSIVSPHTTWARHRGTPELASVASKVHAAADRLVGESSTCSNSQTTCRRNRRLNSREGAETSQAHATGRKFRMGFTTPPRSTPACSGAASRPPGRPTLRTCLPGAPPDPAPLLRLPAVKSTRCPHPCDGPHRAKKESIYGIDARSTNLDCLPPHQDHAGPEVDTDRIGRTLAHGLHRFKAGAEAGEVFPEAVRIIAADLVKPGYREQLPPRFAG